MSTLLELPDTVDMRSVSSKRLFRDGGVMESLDRRDWSKVTGICLHQTACVLGERPQRWINCGCHVGITRGGQTLWLHDFDERVVHGHLWNAQTVGIEVDGLYAGDEARPLQTTWDDPSTSHRESPLPLTNEAIAATRNAIRWIVNAVAAKGGRIRALVAHRQASRSRRNDPGSAIWKEVALPMMNELGLSDGGIGFKLGDGYAIPECWDPRCKGIPY